MRTLKLFSHVERMGREEFVKVCDGEFEGPNRRGRPLGRWKDRMEEYLEERGMSGRGVLEEVRRKCWDRERWRLLLWPSPGWTFPEGAKCQSYRYY